MNTEIVRSLEEITSEAKIIYDRMERDYAHWGELMIEAKKLVPHGQWITYLETNFPQVGARQAQRYMKIVKEPEKTLTEVTHQPKTEMKNDSESFFPTTVVPEIPTSLQSFITSPKEEMEKIQKSFLSHIRGMRDDFRKLMDLREAHPDIDTPISNSFRNEIDLAKQAMEKLYERLNTKTGERSDDTEAEVLRQITGNRNNN